VCPFQGDVDAAVKQLLELKAQYKTAAGTDWKPGQAPAPQPAASQGGAASLNDQITDQGTLVRDLKTKKAAKGEIDAAVKKLLDLKAQYKAATGQDWKPGQTSAAAPAPAGSSSADDLNQKITDQGNLVRDLKGKKAGKADIDAAVKMLLDLKAQYKAATGKDWKPGQVSASSAAAPAPAGSGSSDALNLKITDQGNLVRDLKGKKAGKADIDAAVKLLLDLKAQYKAATGQDWKPGQVSAPSAAAPAPAGSSSADDLNQKITDQGNLVRDLKGKKAGKADIDAAVKLLLDLKAQYKAATGKDWKPGQAPPVAVTPVAPAAADLNEQITAQGNLVRELKTSKADKVGGV